MNTKIQPHWWRKSLAGAILGYTLALGIVGLFAWLGPSGIAAGNKTQFNMWMIAPIWMLIFSFSYLFKTGNQAIKVLALANLLIYSLLTITKALMTTASTGVVT